MMLQGESTHGRGGRHSSTVAPWDRAAIREVRPFYLIVEAVLAGLYTYALAMALVLVAGEFSLSIGLSASCLILSGGRVRVSLTGQNEQLCLDVIDDGLGFEPGADAAASAAGAGHYGLVGMRERARLVGGRLEIESAPGRGTALRVSLPIRKSADLPVTTWAG